MPKSLLFHCRFLLWIHKGIIMPIENYLSETKAIHVNSLRELLDYKKRYICRDNCPVCKQTIKELNNLISMETGKQETGKQIINQISNTDYKRVLYLRHVELKTWKQIEKTMMFSESYLFQIYNKAKAEFDRIEQTF